MQVKSSRLLRVKAVAALFDVSVATIYRAIESGQLRALRLGSGAGAVRVPEHEVQAYAEACAEQARHAESEVDGGAR